MPCDQIIAIADDFTGAAEIAAAGHRAGWPAEVVSVWTEPRSNTLTVLDTDTRLSPPADAARVLSAIGRRLAPDASRFVFKKTDSVLRGPVIAEVTALADALRCGTVLLVPANPSDGRVIRDGTYYVNGTPLHETRFALDPHHPARTANVAAMFGSDPRINVRRPTEELPAAGVIIGAAASPDDVDAWSQRLDPTMLAAGGRDFFTSALATLRSHSRRAADDFLPLRPTLLVCGSLASPTRLNHALQLPARAAGGDTAALDRWIERVLAALETDSLVAVACARSDELRQQLQIRAAYAELVARVVQGGTSRHLMVEGGATASALSKHLGWERLVVVREWAPGVVTLRPASHERLAITVKPGSYVWPDNLWSHVAATR